MRRGTDFSDIKEWFLNGIFTILWLFGRFIRAIFIAVGRLLADVAKNVYGRVIMILGAIALIYIVSLFLGFFK